MTNAHSERGPATLPISKLILDVQNPRLPESLQDGTQDELLSFIAETYNAIEVARSIASHGYFASEPLIVVGQDSGDYVVVEGNRRLVALKVLADPNLLSGEDDADEWRALANSVSLPSEVPVVIASDRNAVVPVIGYRHISGIEPWEPYQKARFIADLVDRDGFDFESVANLVGERTTEIAAHYRNYRIVKQAREEFGADVSRVTGRFGVFTRAMTSLNLRAHISAPAPGDVAPKTNPLPENVSLEVTELFSWVFGDGESEPVLSDSRQISQLGRVMNTQDGLQVLRATRDLEAASIASGGLLQRLLTRLRRADSLLKAAREDYRLYRDDESVQDLIESCQVALQDLVDLDDLK